MFVLFELSSCTPWKSFCFSAVSREFSTAAAQGPIALGLWAANRASRRFVNSFIYDSNLVDPASSHTLVSKIKPCMSKYKHFIL